ncbi:uncharacterized protein LOC130015256 [Mercurialis annua]|uniref:uncharacterized protein LOC130015256 n=1 Tax=Mercurialis annua TaxID=3986 RepID=UPI0024AEE78D|nr:uncharacterized protein LOC130015256 [Mercurialis annua]
MVYCFVYVSIGRSVCSKESSPFMLMIRDDIEKEDAFQGLCAIVRANPSRALSSLVLMCKAIVNWHHIKIGNKEQRATQHNDLCQVLHGYKQVGKSHYLLLEGGLTYDAIRESLAKSTVSLRDGDVELLEFLKLTCFKKVNHVNYLFPLQFTGEAHFCSHIFNKYHRGGRNIRRSFKYVKGISNIMVFYNDGRLISFKDWRTKIYAINFHKLLGALCISQRLKNQESTSYLEICGRLKNGFACIYYFEI